MKKTRIIELIVAAVLLVAGIVFTVLGYVNNVDGTVTKEDTLLFIGYIAIVLGVLLLIVSISALVSKKEEKQFSTSEKIKRLACAGMFAALSYIAFKYFKVDIYVGPEKTSFHLANTFVVLAALFLGGTWGGLAGAVGLTIADLTTDYVTSAPKTFFLKLMIGLIVGFVAHKLFHITKPAKPQKILLATVVSAAAGLAFNIVADPLVGYFYKQYLFGLPQDIAKALAKLSSLTTAVNAGLSVICAVLIYSAVRPALIKAGLFLRLEKEEEK